MCKDTISRKVIVHPQRIVLFFYEQVRASSLAVLEPSPLTTSASAYKPLFVEDININRILSCLLKVFQSVNDCSGIATRFTDSFNHMSFYNKYGAHCCATEAIIYCIF